MIRSQIARLTRSTINKKELRELYSQHTVQQERGEMEWRPDSNCESRSKLKESFYSNNRHKLMIIE